MSGNKVFYVTVKDLLNIPPSIGMCCDWHPKQMSGENKTLHSWVWMCLYQLLLTFVQSILPQILASRLTSSIVLFKKARKFLLWIVLILLTLALIKSTDKPIRQHTTIIYFIYLQKLSILFSQIFSTIPIISRNKTQV